MKTIMKTRVEAGFWTLTVASLLLIVTGNIIIGAIMTAIAITQFKTDYVLSKFPAHVIFKGQQFIYTLIFKLVPKKYLVHEFKVQEVAVFSRNPVKFVFRSHKGYYLAIQQHGVLFKTTKEAMLYLAKEFSSEIEQRSLNQSTTH